MSNNAEATTTMARERLQKCTLMLFKVSSSVGLIVLLRMFAIDKFQQHDLLVPKSKTFGTTYSIRRLQKAYQDSGNTHQDSGNTQRHLFVVDLRDSFLPHTTKLAVQACAGLYNREQIDKTFQNRPIVYTLLNDPYDDLWRKELNLEPGNHIFPFIHPHQHQRLDGTDFLVRCLQDFPRRVRYRYYGPARRVVPNVLTVGSILEAIPLQDGDPIFDHVNPKSLTIVFDALTHPSFSANSEHDATEYVYDTYAKNTTSLAKINPGYSNSSFIPTPGANDYGPPLMHDMDISLVDFIFSHKLFAYFLYYGCVKWWNPGHAKNSHKLVTRMSEDRAGGTWPNPVPVYGYDDSWSVFGGDVFEAETMCVASHNFGQIATLGVNNLSFFSRWSRKVVIGEINNSPDIIGKFERLPKLNFLGQTEDHLHNTVVKDREGGVPSMSHSDLSNSVTTTIRYDTNKVYVALVVGDGDNVLYMKGTRADWMRERQTHCKLSFLVEKKKRCFPLSWTISSHLANIAPDVLRWYIKQAASSKLQMDDLIASLDTFILPPSGHLYSYPGMMPDDVQDNFIKETEQDALLLNTTGVVDWEWFTYWSATEANFYPKYAKNGIIRGIFTVNVPYLFPTDRFFPGTFFKIIEPPEGYEGKPVVMFKPREWRGTPREQTQCRNESADSTKDYLSPAELSKEIESYPKGTVAYIYLTSDGGLSFTDIADMAKLLPDHVELVSTETATAFALLSKTMLRA